MSVFLPLRALALAVFALAAAAPATAQSPSASRLSVVVTCPGYVPGCDEDFFQTEVPWVRFVRDQANADVAVLVADQQTGGGGRRYELYLSGRRGAVAGRRDTLIAQTPPQATEDDQRRALLNRLALGLAGFAARTPAGDRLTLAYAAPAVADTSTGPAATSDPWNGWVFRARTGGFFNGQQQYSSANVNSSFSANRVTEDWKLTARLFANTNRDRFTLTDSTSLTVLNSSFGGFGVAVKTLASHWGVGIYGVAERSTFENHDLRVEVGPGVEYNLYPYGEATRRQLRIQYEVGVAAAIYADTTIFDRTREANAFHELEVKAVFAQPWGSVDVSTEVNQFVTRPDKYRAQLRGNVSVRLLRGLSFDLSGSAALVRNQINLVRGDASDQDVLTRQRELATGYDYFAQVGLSYTFGSVFNPVVNVRFD